LPPKLIWPLRLSKSVASPLALLKSTPEAA
jgi:hypothetical protein